MPNLGDYLGQLLSEIAMARAQADLETVRLAEVYASHPLLKHLPVPHIRLPEVNLDVPVLVQQSEQPRVGETPRGGASREALAKAFDTLLATRLVQAGLELTAPEKRTLGTAVASRVAGATAVAEVAVDVLRLADDLTSTAVATLTQLKHPVAPAGAARPPGSVPATFVDELRDAARVEFLKARTPPPRVAVGVRTAEIKESGGGDQVMRLHLKITEQGMEWKSIETDRGREDRLILE
ncbi:MAG: hypothetical protein HBSAPP03_19930 [Phycisphaerae bacterium]|nr:MAG: hypothetical protein HBSAPP03_19930 [Phycisphaerae bacterium]